MDRSDSDSALRLAECYLSQGLRSEAGRHFADVAKASEQSGREDQAFAAYQRLAELDPSNPSLLMKLGELWLTYGLTQRAYETFNTAGLEYSAQGDEERAQDAYSRAQAVRPADYKTPAALSRFSLDERQVIDDSPMLIDSPASNFNKQELERIIGSDDLSAGVSLEAGDALEMNLPLSSAEHDNVGNNRRRSERISALVPIVVISESGGWREFTQTVDVSDAGLKFKLAHAVPPETVLRVSVNLEKWPSKVSKNWVLNDNEGIVRYCKLRPGQPSIVGFDLIQPSEQMSLEYILQSYTDSL
jgi:tetratricopeptide (TPR) repeat protein